MTEHAAEDLTKIIEEIAFKSMSTEMNDVAGMGELLADLEKVKASGPLSQSLATLVGALISTVETLIFQQGDDLSALMDCFLEGVALLQDRAKADDGGPSTEPAVEAYLSKIAALGVAVEAPAAEASDDSGATKTEPGVEASQAAPDTETESGVEPSQTAQGSETQPDAEEPQAASGPKMEKNVIVDADTCYEFIAETLGNFDEAETTLVELEEDPTNKELINALFRFFHTAKGVSGFLNLKRMNRFAHELENLLDEVRNDRIMLDAEISDFIFKSMDFSKYMLTEVKAALDKGELLEPCYDVNKYINDTAALLSKAAGDASEMGDSEQPLGEILVDMGRISPQDVGEAVARQIEGQHDEMLGEILVQEGKISENDVQEAVKKQAAGSGDKGSTVRVSTAKLDNVVDMVGELVIAESLVFQNPLIQSINDQKIFKDFAQLNRITSELQKTAMSMRMVPIKQTFQKMVRLVRDLARKSGKTVNLHMSGEETEIDRHMVDEIYDPLVHMIRNAVDHGLESPEERKEAGKDAKGNIHLRAYHQGGHLFIEIRDDGRGLNRERIHQKALEKKLVNANDNFTDKEVYNFIFLPGFSTAEKITDISGRGVGMDVVKKFIEKIRGSVEIDSVYGQGTTFIIKLPLTLAIIDGILVKVGQERYIIPTMAVKESIQTKKNQHYTVTGKGEVINIRGRLLPLVRLHHILGVTPEAYLPHEGIVVVLEHEDQEFGLLIDDLVGKQEVVIKSLGSKFKNTKGFSGGAILGDGRVGLILDVKGIFELYHEIGAESYTAESEIESVDNEAAQADFIAHEGSEDRLAAAV